MEDLTGKVTGGTLTAVEWNQLPQEVQNLITATLYAQALSNGDTNQFGKAVAGYAASSTFYTGGGSANAHTASALAGMQSPPNYADGMEVRFRPSNVNTGAATVNVDTLGVKAILKEDGSVLNAGDLGTDRDAWLRYDGTDFLLSNWASAASGSGGGIDLAENTGQLVKTDINNVALKPAIGGEIVINIDGVRLVRTSDLVFNLPDDLDTGSDTNSTAYYLYVDNQSGVMVPKFSISPPIDIGSGGKVGYHPTRTDERCIGSIWNNSGFSGDFISQEWMPDGRVIFQHVDIEDHKFDLSFAASTSWYPITTLNLPLTAMSVTFCNAGIFTSGKGMIVWGKDGAAGGLTSADDDPIDRDILYFAVSDGAAVIPFSITGEIPILDRANPEIRYGITNTVQANFMKITGYHDWCAPTW